MRYNIFNDVIEFQQNGSVLALAPDKRINKVTIGSHTFVVNRFEFKSKQIEGYLERLDSGKLTLLAKMVVVFKEREEPRAMQYSIVPARFNRLGDVHYSMLPDGQLVKIESIKKLLEQLPDKNEEMAAFVKKEKIRDDREGLVKFFSYYNSLP
jgi:hypothetical protein